jgi:cell division transport system permease protein
VSAEQARAEFAEQVDLGAGGAGLPVDAFPASLEIALSSKTSEQRVAKVAERVRQFGAVEEVETYRDWLAQMGALLSAGKSAVVLLSILVTVCVLAIIGNTIRLAVANRRREIEVLKLCGATDGFVASPFVLEGVMQATAAALAALLALAILYFALRGQAEGALMALAGVRTVFLSPLTLLTIVVGGATAGALGSALSLRRYLRV